MEFLVEIWLDVEAVPADELDRLLAAEREEARSMRDAGLIKGMWRVEGEPKTVSIWSAPTSADLTTAIDRLPLRRWLTVRITSLSPHYLFD